MIALDFDVSFALGTRRMLHQTFTPRRTVSRRVGAGACVLHSTPLTQSSVHGTRAV